MKSPEMEMEMEMDSLSFCKHHHQNLPLSPSSGGQEAFSSCYYYHPTDPHPAAGAAAAMVDNNRRDVGPTAAPPPSSRPRSSAAERKDRHSKICTAGGMRDRRMRLSLDVARRFFSLQDKLGFDKASRTVQWLLDMSTVGISHLLAASTTSMSMSEEDGSGSVLLDSCNDHVMVADAETNTCKQQQQLQQVPKAKGRRRAGRKSSINGAPALFLFPDKESRARARQRARERTMERNRIRSSVAAVEEDPAPTRQMILPVSPSNFGSYCCEDQEPWELGGVVFAKPRQH